MSGLKISLPALLVLSGMVMNLTMTVGCAGDSNRRLQSMQVEPAVATAQNGHAEFTAKGAFDKSPTSVDSLPASWIVLGPGVEPPPPGYMLTEGYGTAICVVPGQKYVVVGLSPVNPNAPSSGAVPAQVWNDLVITRSTMEEGGFVAATAQMNCP